MACREGLNRAVMYWLEDRCLLDIDEQTSDVNSLCGGLLAKKQAYQSKIALRQ